MNTEPRTKNIFLLYSFSRLSTHVPPLVDNALIVLRDSCGMIKERYIEPILKVGHVLFLPISVANLPAPLRKTLWVFLYRIGRFSLEIGKNIIASTFKMGSRKVAQFGSRNHFRGSL